MQLAHQLLELLGAQGLGAVGEGAVGVGMDFDHQAIGALLTEREHVERLWQVMQTQSEARP